MGLKDASIMMSYGWQELSKIDFGYVKYRKKHCAT